MKREKKKFIKQYQKLSDNGGVALVLTTLGTCVFRKS